MNDVSLAVDIPNDVAPRALFTAEEVARALSISRSLVRQLTTQGDIPCRRIGRLVRYAQADIDIFVTSREAHGY